MISVVEGNDYLKPYTFNDDYLPLSNNQIIVDAFAAFMEWAIEFAKATIQALLLDPINAVWHGIESWCNGFFALMDKVTIAVESGSMTKEAAAMKLFDYLFGSAILTGIVVVFTALSIALIPLEPLLAPFSFIMAFIVPFIVTLMIQGLAEITWSTHEGVSAAEGGTDSFFVWLADFFGSEAMQEMITYSVILFGTAGMILSLLDGFMISGMIYASLISVIGLLLGLRSNMISEDADAFKFGSLIIAGAGFISSSKYFYSGFLGKVIWSIGGIAFSACLFSMILY